MSMDFFYRISQWPPFTNLIDSGIPLLIIRICVGWYQMQQLCFIWDDSTSSLFYNFKWVRQGDILSQTLFALYYE